MNKLKKSVLLIIQGKDFIDKLTLTKYFIKGIISKLTKTKIDPNLAHEVTIKNHDGIFYCGNHINSVWVASTIHESNIRKYFSLSKGIFVDIGANIGKYTIKIAKQLGNEGQAISIEPEPSNFQILKKNIELNNLKNVHALNLACSSKEGFIDFYINKSGTGAHSLIKKTKNKISVKSSKLDNVLLTLNLPKADLIKIDVEGAEIEVLKGAKKTLKKHPKLIIEIEDSSNLKNVRNFLERFGYKLTKISEEEYFAE